MAVAYPISENNKAWEAKIKECFSKSEKNSVNEETTISYSPTDISNAVFRTLDKWPSKELNEIKEPSQRSYNRRPSKNSRRSKEQQEIDEIFAKSGLFQLKNKQLPYNSFEGAGINPYPSEVDENKSQKKPFESYRELPPLEDDFSYKCKIYDDACSASTFGVGGKKKPLETKKFQKTKCSASSKTEQKSSVETTDIKGTNLQKDKAFDPQRVREVRTQPRVRTRIFYAKKKPSLPFS